MNADYLELQGKIDEAVKTNGVVEVTRDYVIDAPLVMARFEDGEYKFHSAKIVGNSTMWDVGNGNIKATFNDAPILSIHKGKGNIVKGLNLVGNGVERDSRYSPYTALAIDPVCKETPEDGGYPGLKEYYKGSEGKSGSTGVRIEDCTFNKVTVGAITSPNGYTQNAEMITFQNIRIGDVKYGIAGCQPQEKLNRVINIGAWSKCKTLFRFNTYGQARPGHWIIDGVNIAGEVDELIYRASHEYFPLVMSNIYAERLIKIGFWQTFLNDSLNNSNIDLRYPHEMGAMPKAIIDSGGSSGGLTLINNNIRYYGNKDIPMVFLGKLIEVNNNYEGKKINVIPYKNIEGIKMKGSGPVNLSLNALYLNYYNMQYEGISWGGYSSPLPGTYNIGIYD